MINDEFAKIDFSRPMDFSKAVKDGRKGSDSEEVDSDTYGAIISAMMEAMLRDALGENPFEHYEINRIISKSGTVYYPMNNTFTVLPTGHVLFETESYKSARPARVTLVHEEIEAVEWLYDEESAAAEATKAANAA